MSRTTNAVTRVAVAIAVTAALVAVLLAARGPVDTLTWFYAPTPRRSRSWSSR